GRPLRDPQADAAARSSRRGRREARPLCRVGDAGPVRQHPRGAPGRALRRRRVRRVPHGRDRDDRAGGRGVPAADPLQRRLEDRRARRAVLRAHARGRRRPRRPLHLPPRRLHALPDRHERRQPREGPRVVPAPRGRLRRHAPRPPPRLRDARGPGPPRAGAGRGAQRGRRASRPLPHRDPDRRRRARDARGGHGVHGRGRRRAARRARARAGG
ncbi:MAG: Aminomethyltransferase (glycine cleavage system T protein), partial [uncultured Solirubrobacteraceae bacterium]